MQGAGEEFDEVRFGHGRVRGRVLARCVRPTSRDGAEPSRHGAFAERCAGGLWPPPIFRRRTWCSVVALGWDAEVRESSKRITFHRPLAAGKSMRCSLWPLPAWERTSCAAGGSKARGSFPKHTRPAPAGRVFLSKGHHKKPDAIARKLRELFPEWRGEGGHRW